MYEAIDCGGQCFTFSSIDDVQDKCALKVVKTEPITLNMSAVEVPVIQNECDAMSCSSSVVLQWFCGVVKVLYNTTAVQRTKVPFKGSLRAKEPLLVPFSIIFVEEIKCNNGTSYGFYIAPFDKGAVEHL